MKQTKRIVSLCLALVMLLAMFPVTASADGVYTYYTGDGYIRVDLTTGTVVEADPNMSYAYIPESVNGVPITEIGDSAFENHSSLFSVSLPNGLTRIGAGAFAGCESLYFMEMPDSVETIDICAFEYCVSLRDFRLPASLTKIGWNAFLACESLTAVNIPEGVTAIGEWAYCGCLALETVTFPSTLQEIGAYAFSECYALNDVLIPPNVSHLGMCAFDIDLLERLQFDPNNPHFHWENGILFGDNKKALYYFPADRTGSYTVPYGVKAIRDGAFKNSELFEIILPDTVETIGESAFSRCLALTAIRLPAALREIGEYAFGSCENLKTVTFGKKLETIGDSAFWGCHALTELDFPDSLQVIGENAFESCWSLKNVDMPYSMKAIGERAFYQCAALTEIIIPQGIEIILPDTFYNCTNMTHVTFPLSLKRTEQMAFAWCRDLDRVYYEGNQEQWKKLIRCGTGDYNYDQICRVRVTYNAEMPIPPTGTSYTAIQPITVDGKAVELQAYALKNRQGYLTNYVKLRDIATLVNGSSAQFNIDWDGAVNIITGTAYEPNGSEMFTPFAGDRNYEVAFAETKIDGIAIKAQAILLKNDQGGGYTYYKLRDIAEALNFDVSWSADVGITIDTDKPYTAD